MKYILSIILGFFSLYSFSQTDVLTKIPRTGKIIDAFIPKEYDTLQTAKGDLNKDGKEDVVLVLRHKKENAEGVSVDNIPKRLLVILFKAENGYLLGGSSSSGIMCMHCGGIFGDPFNKVDIHNGVLTVRHYGGSAWRWGYTHIFRFQNNGFYLIGWSIDSYWNGGYCEKLKDFYAAEHESINFITGDYEKKKISEQDCVLLENKKGKVKVKPLISLKNFSIEQN